MILLALIFGSLGAIALGFLVFIALDEWAQERCEREAQGRAYEEALYFHRDAVRAVREHPCRERMLHELHARHTVTLARAILLGDEAAQRQAKLLTSMVCDVIIAESQPVPPEIRALVAKAAMN